MSKIKTYIECIVTIQYPYARTIPYRTDQDSKADNGAFIEKNVSLSTVF
jgi:hypothetical protein